MTQTNGSPEFPGRFKMGAKLRQVRIYGVTLKVLLLGYLSMRRLATTTLTSYFWGSAHEKKSDYRNYSLLAFLIA